MMVAQFKNKKLDELVRKEFIVRDGYYFFDGYFPASEADIAMYLMKKLKIEPKLIKTKWLSGYWNSKKWIYSIENKSIIKTI